MILSRGLYAGAMQFFIWLSFFTIVSAELFSILIGLITITKAIIDEIDKDTISPLEPDRCGGLKPIGRLCLIAPTVVLIGVSVGTISLKMGGQLDSPNFLRYHLALLFIWGFGIFLFIYPQPKIHRQMVEIKQRELRSIAEKLKKIGIRNLDDLSKDTESALLTLQMINLFNETEKMNEWPFDAQIAKTIIAIAVIPLVLQIVTKFIPI